MTPEDAASVGAQLGWIVAALEMLVAPLIIALLTSVIVTRREFRLLRESQKLDYAVEDVILRLLSHEEHRKRSLKEIKKRIRGFEKDDDLRQALLRAGAVAFEKSDASEPDEKELWGLLERNEEDVK